MYFDVAPAIPLSPGKELFTYQSEEKLIPGAIVRVPIGRRQVNGVVIGKLKKKPPYRTKDISRVFSAALTPQQLAFGAQIAGVALGGLGFTLRLFYPPSLRIALPVYTKRPSKYIRTKGEALLAPLANRVDTIEKQAQRVTKNGGQVLVLVPERWMIQRFSWATPFHAGMNVSQAGPVWEDVASGKPVAVVGTQKALFLPWRDLRLIVLDEAQLPTHKLWDGYPRGDNRRLVGVAATTYKASHVLSGPLPSLQLYYQVKQQKSIVAKIWKPSAPKYQILPFSFGDRRHGRLLPENFVETLREWKHAKKRVFILHNEKDGRVAKALRSLRLLKKDQVIIGTSALFAKLQDEKFDQVAWMFPETALAAADFRSHERGYILFARLASMQKSPRRAVTLVTRQPSFIEKAVSGSITQLYKGMLAERKKYNYPPYADMVKLTFRARSNADATGRAVAARHLIEKKLVAEREHTRVLGPYGTRPVKDSKAKVERHLLLLGDIAKLALAYRAAFPDLVDLDPERVL